MTIVIYPNSIQEPAKVMDVLNGNSQFYIENPYITVPGVRPPDTKQWLSIRPGKSTFGVMLQSPHIFTKSATGAFTNKFVICLAKQGQKR